MKILILALSGIGDALMFTPALRKLKEDLPSSEIHALVMFKGVNDIYLRNPNLDKVMHFDFLKEGALRSLSFLMKLRGNYDITINVYPSNRKEYNIFNILLGAKRRAGVRYNRMDMVNLGFLNNVSIHEDDSLHNVEENLKLVEKITGKKNGQPLPLEFPLSEDDHKWAEAFMEKHIPMGAPLIIGMHPGCATLKNHIMRRWEPDKFARLAVKFIREKKAKVLLFGGPEESALRKEIMNLAEEKDLLEVSAPGLAESAAVMKKCNLFVTNDSSLLHVSSAMRLKVLAIIGPTNTNYIHPWQTEYRIASLGLECAPCFFYSPKPLSCSRTDVQYKCIKELMPEKVYSIAEEMLA